MPEGFYYGRNVKGRDRQKLPVGGEGAIGDKPMTMGIEVYSVGAVSLKRQHAAGAYIFSAEQSLKGFRNRGICGLRQ